MKFRELEIGKVFTFAVALLGEHDFRYQKLSDTEVWDFHYGIRVMAKDAPVFNVEDGPTLHDTPSEIERAALTMLKDGCPEHPFLNRMAKLMIRDPNEMRELDELARGDTGYTPEQLSRIAEAGYTIPTSSRLQDGEVAMALLDENGTPEEFAEEDRASVILWRAIYEYRQRGRVGGETEATIEGMGSPILRRSTSLAAAVVEYHKRMINYALRYKEEL